MPPVRFPRAFAGGSAAAHGTGPGADRSSFAVTEDIGGRAWRSLACMNPAAAFLVIVLLVAGASALGLLWRRRQGRVTAASGRDAAEPVTAAELGSDEPLGPQATLLQFST